MTDSELTNVAEPLASADPALVGRHHSLVLASAILATAGMLVSAAYGIWNDLLVLRALALDAALVALAAWLCLNACGGGALFAHRNRLSILYRTCEPLNPGIRFAVHLKKADTFRWGSSTE
jgi:hypothetical protein